MIGEMRYHTSELLWLFWVQQKVWSHSWTSPGLRSWRQPPPVSVTVVCITIILKTIVLQNFCRAYNRQAWWRSCPLGRHRERRRGRSIQQKESQRRPCKVSGRKNLGPQDLWTGWHGWHLCHQDLCESYSMYPSRPRSTGRQDQPSVWKQKYENF